MVGAFAVIVRRGRNGLWRCTALYNDRHGKTLVSTSWHRLRSQAALEAFGFAHA